MKRINKCLIIIIVLINSFIGVNAQCTTGTLWPGATYNPVCNGTPGIITASAWTGEYSNVNLIAGTTYTFASSVGTDYLTVTDAAVVPQVTGTGSVAFLCPTTGVYRIYRHLSAACNSSTASRTITVTCTLPPPANDACTGAIMLGCGDVVVGSTSTATTETDNCFANWTSSGVWYSFVGNGLDWTISLCGSSFDTYLSLYEGPDCMNLTCIDANDDDCGLQSQLTDIPTTVGTTYWILVKGYNTAAGNFTLSLTTPTVSNDACSNATAITPGSYSGNTTCTGVDAAPAAGTATIPTDGGVWYSYTAGCSGNVTASLCSGTTYNTQLSVFTGPCGALAAVDGNDDFCSSQSEVTWPGVLGTTYYILVHGNGAEGAFTLNLAQEDIVAPVADVDPLPTETSTCSVTLTAPTALDNCAGPITGTTTDPITYSAVGIYTVTWTYDDGNGNTTTQTQTVDIQLDAVAPTFTGTWNDTTMSNDEGVCGAVFSYTPPLCGGTFVLFDQPDNDNIDNGYFIDQAGPYYLADNFTVPDGLCWDISELSMNLWEFTPGSLNNLEVVIMADAGGVPGAIISTQNLTPADWTSTFVGTNFGYVVSDFDLVLPTPVNVCGGPGGTTYWLGLHENSGFGDYAWSNTQPVSGPAGMSAGSFAGPWAPASGVDDFMFSITGSLPATVTDNCPECPTVTQTAGLPSGSVFPVGTTTNVFTATDAHGNTSSVSFDVTVQDTELPVPSIDSNVVVDVASTNLPMLLPDNTTTWDSVLVAGAPTTMNGVDLASVCIDIDHTWVSDLTLSLVSPQGTIVLLSAANGGGGDDYIQTCFDMNAATPINLGAAPFIGSYIPQDPMGFDAFNGEDPNGYWKLSAFDAFTGDVGVLYEFEIHFDFHYNDILPVVYADCSTITAPTANDNCDGSITATTTDPTSYTTEGTYVINWTYTDAAGNSFTQTQEVIVNDNTAPVADLSSLPDVIDTCSVTVSTPPTATDDCGGVINGTTTDSVTYYTAGTYTITWTYDDGNGNITTQSQNLVVVDDVPPVPSTTILPNVVGNCVVTVSTTPTATDNCSGEVITGTTMDPLVYNVVGTHFITWVYTDASGNTWTQNQTVVVEPCLGVEDEAGNWNALVYPNPGNGIFTLTLSELPAANTEIKMVNALGQVIYSSGLTSQVQQFDFSYLASGTYYLLISSSEGHISKPVIIRQNY